MKVTEEHVKRVLQSAQLSDEEWRRILSIQYPAELDDVAQVAASMGITKDWLISQMGGSP